MGNTMTATTQSRLDRFASSLPTAAHCERAIDLALYLCSARGAAVVVARLEARRDELLGYGR